MGTVIAALVGTVIVLLRKLKVERNKRMKSSRQALSSSPTGPTLLVVDDEPLFLSWARRFLTRNNYQVVLCAGYHDVKHEMESGRHVDLLVTDIALREGATGRLIADLVKHYQPKAPVIYVSGYDNIEVGDKILLKPFEADVLLTLIREKLTS